MNKHVLMDLEENAVAGPRRKEAVEAVRTLLGHVGEDAGREGLLKTPDRVVNSLDFLTGGYKLDAKKVIKDAIFDVDVDEMVIVRDIEIYSLCEHHLLPFFGKAHVAYLPKGKVIGLSKIPRVVDVFARRLQVQERLTREIANSIRECVPNKGVGVVIEARHLCMMMRGVQKQNSGMITSCMLGAFRNDSKTRSEFLRLLDSNRM